MGWYVARDGAQWGPYSREQLMEIATRGQLAATDNLWSDGMASWQPAAVMIDLFPPGTTFGQGRSIGDDPAMRWIMPVGRSSWAIIAGYLGLISILLFPAPFALIVGVVAIFDIKRNPDRHGMGRAIFGVVMGAVFTALLIYVIIVNVQAAA